MLDKIKNISTKSKMWITVVIGLIIIGILGNKVSDTLKYIIIITWISGIIYFYLQMKKEYKLRLETDPEFAKLEEERKALKLAKLKQAQQQAQQQAQELERISEENKRRKQGLNSQGQMTCPKCGSTQLHAGKKPLSLKRAVVGTVLLNPVGGVIGAVTSKKLVITCMNCGHHWKAGKRK